MVRHLKLIEQSVKWLRNGPLGVFIMLVKLCYPTGNARVSDNNTIYVSLIFKDNPLPRYIKHVATYICGLLVKD